MAQHPFFAALNPNEYRVVGAAAYGEMEGYPFRMLQSASNRLTVFITVQSPLDKPAAKAVRGELRGQGIKAKANGRVLTYIRRLGRDTIPGDVLTGVYAAVSALRRCGALPPTVCAVCRQGDTDACMLVRGNYDAVHSVCADRLHAGVQAKARENPGSYGRGVLGGLIGAIVGALPAFLAILILNIISAWLFMLIPMAAYYGYKKLGGKMDRVASIASILLSLVGLAFVLVSWNVAQNMQWMGMDLGGAVSYTFANLFLSGNSFWKSTDVIYTYLFFLLGVAISFGSIRRTNQSDLKSADQMYATLLRRRQPRQEQPRAEAAAPLPGRIRTAISRNKRLIPQKGRAAHCCGALFLSCCGLWHLSTARIEWHSRHRKRTV